MSSNAKTLLFAAVAAAAVGCESGPAQPSMEDRQNAALKDPFSYGPAMPTPGKPAPANGQPAAGGTTPIPEPENKQRDDSLKGEWKRFWDP